jgi:hypothetical protein
MHFKSKYFNAVLWLQSQHYESLGCISKTLHISKTNLLEQLVHLYRKTKQKNLFGSFIQ